MLGIDSAIVAGLQQVSGTGERLRELVNRLSALGYAEFVTSLDPFRFSPQHWPSLRHVAFPDLRLAIDFLLLNEKVHADRLSELLGDSWRVLTDLTIAADLPGDLVVIPKLSLNVYLGFYFFLDSPTEDPNVYFGDDSIGLLTRLTPLPHDRSVDLCSGSGIQAMQTALHCTHVDAVEINPIARRILWINARLNGLGAKITEHARSLFDEIPHGERYDFITANPPLVPFPDTIHYPFVGHGGLDGLAVIIYGEYCFHCPTVSQIAVAHRS